MLCKCWGHQMSKNTLTSRICGPNDLKCVPQGLKSVANASKCSSNVQMHSNASKDVFKFDQAWELFFMEGWGVAILPGCIRYVSLRTLIIWKAYVFFKLVLTFPGTVTSPIAFGSKLRLCVRSLDVVFYCHQIHFGFFLASPLRKIRFRKTHPKQKQSIC